MLRGSRGLPGLQSALTKPALEGSGWKESTSCAQSIFESFDFEAV